MKKRIIQFIKEALYVPLILVASGALCLAVAKVWNYCWGILLTTR
jgi:hypothetical protein